MTLTAHKQESVGQLLPLAGQVNLFPEVTILEDISCHLATANSTTADEPWAVITDRPLSLQTFARYGHRFGGIEPHFKDYKSAGFDLIRSRLRNAHALTCILMLLATAHLLALHWGFLLTHQGHRSQVDWHSQRGLSFLQLGLRQLQRLCDQNLPLPLLKPLPLINPPSACASRRKKATLACRIEFERVTVFSP